MVTKEWYVEIYDEGNATPKHTQYMTDFHDALTFVKDNNKHGKTVRIVTPTNAEETELDTLKRLGAIVN